MTKRTAKPTVDMNRISDSHRQQIERVVQIGAKIGLNQQRQNQEILKAVSRNFDAMIDMMDEGTRKIIFAALIDAATVADAKRIKQHPGCQEREAETLAQVVQHEQRMEKVVQTEA